MIGRIAERIAVLGLGVALSACSGNGPDTATTNTATSTATETSASGENGFTPPTTTSRLDYGTRMEQRFQRMDLNGDGKIMAAELPAGRSERLLERLDTSGDGAIGSGEWTTGMMTRFDQLDANKDGSLTSEERDRRRDTDDNVGAEAAAADNGT